MSEKIINLNEMENWQYYSAATQNNLELAQKSCLDAVGLLMTEKYNPNELISLFQTLADPALCGEFHTKEVWKTKSNNRVRNIASDVQPYTLGGHYNAHALISLPSTFNKTQFPLVSNYSSSNLYEGLETRCPRFDKLVKNVTDKLNINVAFTSLSSSLNYLTKTKKGYEIANKLTYGSTFSLNDFDKLVLLSNVVATKIVEDYVANNLKEYKKDRAKYSKTENTIIDTLVGDILTLAVVRATDLGNSEAAYRIDEALKLQISNDLALMSSSGIDVTKKVVQMVNICGKEIATKLDFSVERIATNMRNLGFEYKKEPKTVLDAIFNATNIGKSYNIDTGVIYVKEPKKRAIKKSLVSLSESAIKAGVTNLQLRLPGYIDNQILTSQTKAKLGLEKSSVVTPVESLMCILKNKTDHLTQVFIGYDVEKKKIITNVIKRYTEQREEDLGKSYKTLLNRTLNEMYNEGNETKKSGPIIRNKVKEIVKGAKKTPADTTHER